MLKIQEYANGATFGQFVQACKKHLSMTYEEAVEWLHKLKKKNLVFECPTDYEFMIPPHERDYKNYCIYCNFGFNLLYDIL